MSLDRRAFHRLLAGVVVAAAPFAAFAQAWPVKPIRVVIPYPPGGVDITVRLLGTVMEKELGQPLVIDYKPGAGGMIGHEHVARSAPDGYTLIATVANPWINQPALRKSMPYDPIRDFTPISIVAEGGNMIVANPSFPANNIRELIDYAKKNPGKVSFASSGLGGAQHLDGEAINRLAGIDMVHVPFQGFGPMLPAMVSGQVPIGLITMQVVGSFVKSGKLKVLGSADAQQSALLPPGTQLVRDVLPAFRGLPTWLAFGGPAGLPRPIVDRVHDSIVKAIRTPELASRFLGDGIALIGSTPEEFATRIRNEFPMVQKAIRDTGIPPQD